VSTRISIPLFAALSVLPLCAQAGTVYQVSRSVGAGTITGIIETNGTTGPLSQSDIVSWSFDAFDGEDSVSISSADGGFTQGNAWNYLSATASQLIFDFDGAAADASVELISFHGQDNDPQTYSFDYNLVASGIGNLEQLVHQFGTDGLHLQQVDRSGQVVIGEVGRGAARSAGVVYSVHFGGSDVCEAFGLAPGCDANYSGSAVRMADGSARGQVNDTFAGGGAGLHATIDCLHVAGNDAWLSGVIKHGTTPRGFDLAGFPVIFRVRDNGTSAAEPPDAVSASQIGNATPCYMEPDIRMFDYSNGQVTIN